MASRTYTGSAGIPELDAIELNSAAALKQYAGEARKIQRALATQFEMASEEIYAVLCASGQGNPLLMGIDVKIKAKRVRARLRRASKAASESSIECTRMWVQFVREFGDVIKPAKRQPKQKFNWEE